MCTINDIKPLKIELEGDYWDSQIYKGRLYLWKIDGNLIVIDWEKLIADLIRENDKGYSLTIESAFMNSDNLYSNKELATMLSLLNYKNEFKSDLDELSKKEFVFSEKKLAVYIINEFENPFKDIPTDMDIYYDTFYSLLDSGLWKIKFDSSSNEIFSESKVTKLWDCPLLALKIRSGGRIGLAGGNEGVFEYDVFPKTYLGNSNELKKIQDDIVKISDCQSLFINWSYSSIYNSSDIAESSLLAFEGNKDSNKLNYIGNISQKEIFNSEEKTYLSWANDDKIYRITSSGVDMIRFTQSKLKEGSYKEAFWNKQTFDIKQSDAETAICAGVGLFGNVIEYENGLLIMQSNNEIFDIKGPITRWRMFPRSVRYENQLHVVLDEKLEIYSFNSDYFIDQEEKVFGSKRYFNKKRGKEWG
ncbi:hypothetical protein [Clostridium butyricum]|uniref:hypothetical protein n=1 Tax=Clostridium butyricum TaxID=1492 RepID=UPI00374E8030